MKAPGGNRAQVVHLDNYRKRDYKGSTTNISTCCEICGLPRRIGDTWRRLCHQCENFNKIGQALNAFSQFMREGE